MPLKENFHWRGFELIPSHGRVGGIRFERELLSPRTAPRADRTEIEAQRASQRLPVRLALIVIVTLSAALWFGIAELVANFF
ncbi:MAG TPA: hypothetical protein VFN46_07870 [Acetobacteraceae bacterium]|nr:hypothetical protein [Acetobacteraceae bacterium]